MCKHELNIAARRQQKRPSNSNKGSLLAKRIFRLLTAISIIVHQESIYDTEKRQITLVFQAFSFSNKRQISLVIQALSFSNKLTNILQIIIII